MSSPSTPKDNIETFNLIVGMVLADMYENFPIPADLSGFEYARRAGLHTNGSEVLAPPSENAPAEAAIEWLIAEGYIRRSHGFNSNGFTTRQGVLTLQGLRLLSLPQSLEKQETLGEGLMKATSAGAKEGLKSAIGQMVKTGLIEGGKAGFQLAIQAAIQAAK